MVLKQFYRKDRKYWYKLIIYEGKFHIIYDYRKGVVGSRLIVKEYNKLYSYPTIDEALSVFNSWQEKYK